MNSIVQIHSSGWETIGLIIYAVLLFVFLTLAVGFIFISKYKVIWRRRQSIYYAVCLTAMFLMMGARLLPHFFEFNSISIQEDGTWIFRNGLGIKLGEISGKIPRNILITQGRMTYYGVSYRSADVDYLFITSEYKKFFSSTDLPDSILAIAEKLHQKQLSQNIGFSSPPIDSRPQILRCLQISTAILFLFSLLSPLFIFKLKSKIS